jgi:ApaG protein
MKDETISQKSSDIKVTVKTLYLQRESESTADRYVFVYFINIQNNGSSRVRLLTRHWFITDANGSVEEVTGEGVVGEQPYIQPSEFYEYNSFTILRTPVGSMEGTYRFVNDDGHLFDAPIPVFGLAIPRILN